MKGDCEKCGHHSLECDSASIVLPDTSNQIRFHGSLEELKKYMPELFNTVMELADGWIFVDDQMPPEDDYILGCSGEGSPVFITRLHNGEWDTGANRKRPCYLGKEMFKTSCAPTYWMLLPKPPKDK